MIIPIETWSGGEVVDTQYIEAPDPGPTPPDPVAAATAVLVARLAADPNLSPETAEAAADLVQAIATQQES